MFRLCELLLEISLVTFVDVPYFSLSASVFWGLWTFLSLMALHDIVGHVSTHTLPEREVFCF